MRPARPDARRRGLARSCRVVSPSEFSRREDDGAGGWNWWPRRRGEQATASSCVVQCSSLGLRRRRRRRDAAAPRGCPPALPTRPSACLDGWLLFQTKGTLNFKFKGAEARIENPRAKRRASTAGLPISQTHTKNKFANEPEGLR